MCRRHTSPYNPPKLAPLERLPKRHRVGPSASLDEYTRACCTVQAELLIIAGVYHRQGVMSILSTRVDMVFSRSRIKTFGTRTSRNGRSFFRLFMQESVVSARSVYKKRVLSTNLEKTILVSSQMNQSVFFCSAKYKIISCSTVFT
jgi:hypothetical protein